MGDDFRVSRQGDASEVNGLTRRSLLVGSGATLLLGCREQAAARARSRAASPLAQSLIAAARKQIGVTLTYDPAYTQLSYPGGDVSRSKGVCTDVVVRAYRDAFGIDLQKEVHQDMSGHFSEYPKIWGLKQPDPSIDHRRVPNLAAFWTRLRSRLPIPAQPAGWQPGDLFTMMIDKQHPHTGIISDRLADYGNPLVIHNIGQGTHEQDWLFAWPLTGRFRWKV